MPPTTRGQKVQILQILIASGYISIVFPATNRVRNAITTSALDRAHDLGVYSLFPLDLARYIPRKKLVRIFKKGSQKLASCYSIASIALEDGHNNRYNIYNNYPDTYAPQYLNVSSDSVSLIQYFLLAFFC